MCMKFWRLKQRWVMFIFRTSGHASVLAINKLMPAQIWSNLTFLSYFFLKNNYKLA